jgi:hypothetical protein
MTVRPNNFTLLPANGFVWNKHEFLKFLADKQDHQIVVNTHEEGVCLESAGVYQLIETFRFRDVTIVTNNPLEQHSHFTIQIDNPQKFFQVTNQSYEQYHTWNKNKIFGCLYNRPLWHRIGLAAEMQSKHNDVSMINFRSNPHDTDQQQLFEVQQLFEQAPQSMEKFCQVSNTWPLQVESTDCYTVGNTTNAHTDQLANFYSNFFIDLVAETWTQGRCFFPTEKTIRPMLLKKPMIVMGSRDYLDYLHQMGFRTFNDFWDETYDGFEGKERYKRILQLVDSLAKKSKSELTEIYQSIQHILDHNHNLLMNQSYLTNITYIC